MIEISFCGKKYLFSPVRQINGKINTPAYGTALKKNCKSVEFEAKKF